MPLDLKDFSTDETSSAYRRIVERVRKLREPAVPYPDSPRMAIRERLVRCFWFDQNLTTDDLRADGGQKLRVLSPGWWNLEAGPDFKNAVIRLGRGEIVKGDVEVHIYSSGWKAHGHHEDPNYNSVILHVVMWDDIDSSTVLTADGIELPQLRLEPYLEGELGELAEMVNPEDYPADNSGSVGLCHRKLIEHGVDEEWLGTFLDAAGDERILGRAARFRKRLGQAPPDQLFYEGVMEALGYKRNKSQFRMLASIATLERLRRLCPADEPDVCRVQIQAALFGSAGLLPTADELDAFDDETRRYAGPLLDRWSDIRDNFADTMMLRPQWKLAGVRPANTPPRRIAAITFIIARYLHRDLLEPFRTAVMQGSSSTRRGCVRIRRDIENILAEFPDNYWSYRSSFGGSRRETPQRLVGRSRSLAIITNTVVPALLAQAKGRRQKDLALAVHRFYGHLPRLDDNSVERFVRQRIFAGDAELDKLVNSARRQQGLHQIFKDYCERDARGCRQCALAAALGE